MATNICSSTRTRYVTVKEFMELFSLKKSRAYELVNEEDFPKRRFGKNSIRIPLQEAITYVERKYN